MIPESKRKPILIAAGGTGGHIYPAIAIFDLLKKGDFEVNFITDSRGIQHSQLSKINPITIKVKGFEGKSVMEKITSLFLICSSCIKAILIIRRKKIKLIIGFGSYVQVPVLLAAKLLNIDIILHEANAVLGRANRVFWNFVKLRTSAYKIDYKNLNSILVGTPVRHSIVQLNRRPYKEHFVQKKCNILILGGSLGSMALSLNLSKCLAKLPYKLRKKIKVFHQVTKNQKKDVITEYKLAGIRAEVKVFIENISSYLNVAHIVICRAGASTIAENLIAKLPAIYIPLPSAIGNHQYLNTKPLLKEKAAWVFNEDAILNNDFLKLIKKIISTKDILNTYSKNTKSIALPNASEKFYKLVTGVLNAEF